MTDEEFAIVRASTIAAYVEQHVVAGPSTLDVAEQRATEQMDDLLSDGVSTRGMLLLVAESTEGDAIGHVWLGFERAASPVGTAWLYGIEVDQTRRGRGYGTALLAAAEDEARARGASAMGLNVFASNTSARRLYDSAGYALTAQQMQKGL